MSRNAPGAEQGLTLLEVLVALVITSFVVTLLGQMLQQAMRIEQSLDAGRFEQGVLRLRAGMLREAIRGALPVRSGSGGQPFEGSAQMLRLQTSASPFASTGEFGALEFGIRYDKASDRSALYVRPLDMDGKPPADSSAVTLFDWPGRAGSFQYLDHLAQWHVEWSQAPASERRVLPTVVAVETGMAEWPRLIVQIDASAMPPPVLKELERL
ncbi:type II secretion system protein J [Roseateles sp.]|jgi:prepilin-type N-terminal cleavage/methylation domain-containing protein|uniref:type II secretion system protein J n=1 Tax=Roseateles sp. TaxID=1971397 RepID=UPI0037C77D76